VLSVTSIILIFPGPSTEAGNVLLEAMERTFFVRYTPPRTHAITHEPVLRTVLGKLRAENVYF
jgi:hypothetical protein